MRLAVVAGLTIRYQKLAEGVKIGQVVRGRGIRNWGGVGNPRMELVDIRGLLRG